MSGRYNDPYGDSNHWNDADGGEWDEPRSRRPRSDRSDVRGSSRPSRDRGYGEYAGYDDDPRTRPPSRPGSAQPHGGSSGAYPPSGSRSRDPNQWEGAGQSTNYPPDRSGGYGRGERYPSAPGQDVTRGRYGQPEPYDESGYGQPGPRSRGGYGQPGPHSRGGYGAPDQGAAFYPPDMPTQGSYGQPASTSRGWQPGAATYPGGQWGAPGQQGPGISTATPWGAPPHAGWQAQTPAVPQRKSHRKLWITLAVIAALLVVTCGGVGFAAVQYFAPSAMAGVFCGNLKVQNYAAAYKLLDTGMQSQLSSDQFTQDAQTLDRAGGPVLDCKGAGAYTYSLGGSTAAMGLTITRSTAGTLTGTMHLVNEAGSWKVDSLDTSLLGVNLGALHTASSYCAAIQSKKYSDAYALLGTAQTSKTKAADFTQTAQWHDQIDGPVSACQVVGLGSGNTDTAANLTLSITRDKLGEKHDTLGLDVESAAWKVSAVGAELQGTDLSALRVSLRFCSDMSNSNYTDAFNLLSATGKGNSTEDQFAAAFSGATDGIQLTACSPEISTYTTTTTVASMTVDLTVMQLSTSQTGHGKATLKLSHSGSAWKVDEMALQN